MNLRLTASLLLIVFCGSPALPGSSPKTVRAVRVAEPPTIDGAVTEPVWQSADPVMDFTQYDPDEGAVPSEVTSVRILFDDDALYVGVICYDSDPRQIVQQLTRRDRTGEADRFSIMIDSYHDRWTAFLFSANVAGVQSDGILSQDGLQYDVTWDAVWDVRTRLYRDGWSAEFRIPYNALRFGHHPDRQYEWGINFRRYISRKHETDEWVMVPRNATIPGTVSSVSLMGNLVGLANIDPPLNLGIAPYVSGKGSYSTEPSSSTYAGDAGLDLKYGLSPNFTLDATVNPDFGQVEVDQAVLNLTVFETLYPEKRPFFVEGSQLFTFGSSIDNTSQTTGSPLALFFSRRIGKQPTGYASVVAPAGGTVVDNPTATTILGAAKVTGRSTGGLSLGTMAAATGEMNARVKDAAGSESTIMTEPRGGYGVVRVKQDWSDGNWLGVLATLASHEFMLPALSGGVDWNLRFDEGMYALDGYVAAARGSRDDAVSRDGAAGRLLASRLAGEHWLYTASADFATRYFNINDIGFFAQPHDRGGYAQVMYRENFGTGVFRLYRVALNPEFRWNWDGVRTNAVLGLSLTGMTKSFWSSTILYEYLASAYDDEEQGIIGLYRRPDGHRLTAQVISDTRGNVTGSLSGSYETDARGKDAFLGSLGLTLRPASWMEISTSLLYELVRDEEAAIFSPSSGGIVTQTVAGATWTLFGDRAVDQLGVALRGIVTFTRTVSLQFFCQVLLARGTYANYRRLTGEGSFDASGTPTTSYDFNTTTFNANVLLRWEFLPGSAAYLVWTQGRYGDSGVYGTTFGTRFRETFKLPHDDVLLLKISYWIPM